MGGIMKKSLNLMTARSQQREQIHRCLRVWTRAVAVAFLVLSIVGFAKYRTCRQEEQRQAAAEAEYEPVRQLKIENSRLTKGIESLESSEWLALALAKQQPLLSLIGFATQAVAEQGNRVYLKQVDIERDISLPNVAATSKLSFSLEGEANQAEAIKLLANTLRDTGPFANVELETVDKATAALRVEQPFSIQCTN